MFETWDIVPILLGQIFWGKRKNRIVLTDHSYEKERHALGLCLGPKYALLFPQEKTKKEVCVCVIKHDKDSILSTTAEYSEIAERCPKAAACSPTQGFLSQVLVGDRCL